MKYRRLVTCAIVAIVLVQFVIFNQHIGKYWILNRPKELARDSRTDLTATGIYNVRTDTTNTTALLVSIAAVINESNGETIKDSVIQSAKNSVVQTARTKTVTSRNAKSSRKRTTQRPQKALVDVIASNLLGSHRNISDPLVGDPMGYMTLDSRKKLELHCSSCALVFSSGHLIHSNAGKEIDQFQCIFRMNNNPTNAYSKDVGKRTTVRYIAHSSLGHVMKAPQEFFKGDTKPKIVVVWGPPPKMRTDGRGSTFNGAKRLQKIYRDVDFYFETPKEYRFTSIIFERVSMEKKTGNWLTTGWRTMMLALNTCDSLNVYGMSKYDACRKPHTKPVPFHYFGAEGRTECSLYERSEKHHGSGHRFETEKLIFEYLSHVYNITFRYPSWSSKGNFGV